MSKKPPTWQLPSIIAGGIVALGALGTFIVKSANYITLPEKVEASEKKNAMQDETLTKLGTIAEQNQKLLDKWDGIYQQQQQHAPNQAAPHPSWRYWTDDQGQCWRCDVRWDCERDDNWERCD